MQLQRLHLRHVQSKEGLVPRCGQRSCLRVHQAAERRRPRVHRKTAFDPVYACRLTSQRLQNLASHQLWILVLPHLFTMGSDAVSIPDIASLIDCCFTTPYEGRALTGPDLDRESRGCTGGFLVVLCS